MPFSKIKSVIFDSMSIATPPHHKFHLLTVIFKLLKHQSLGTIYIYKPRLFMVKALS